MRTVRRRVAILISSHCHVTEIGKHMLRESRRELNRVRLCCVFFYFRMFFLKYGSVTLVYPFSNMTVYKNRLCVVVINNKRCEILLLGCWCFACCVLVLWVSAMCWCSEMSNKCNKKKFCFLKVIKILWKLWKSVVYNKPVDLDITSLSW